jgi:uncharacterized protein (TIGR02466 family)
MNITRNLEMLFPTPVSVVLFDDLEFFKNLAHFIISNLSTDNLLKLKFDNVCTTDDNLHTLDEFNELKKFIDVEISGLFSEVIGVDPNDVEISGMWANVQQQFGVHYAHQHPNSYYSGVIYLDIPKNTENPGDIFFVDPRQSKNMSHPDFIKQSPLSNRMWKFTPQTGMMLLFPSWLEHGTQVCRLNEGQYRISLSFNYALKKCSSKTMRIT